MQERWSMKFRIIFRMVRTAVQGDGYRGCLRFMCRYLCAYKAAGEEVARSKAINCSRFSLRERMARQERFSRWVTCEWLDTARDENRLLVCTLAFEKAGYSRVVATPYARTLECRLFRIYLRTYCRYCTTE